jgi:hypothetical protein
MKIPTPSAQTHVDLFDKDGQRNRCPLPVSHCLYSVFDSLH